MDTNSLQNERFSVKESQIQCHCFLHLHYYACVKLLVFAKLYVILSWDCWSYISSHLSMHMYQVINFLNHFYYLFIASRLYSDFWNCTIATEFANFWELVFFFPIFTKTMVNSQQKVHHTCIVVFSKNSSDWSMWTLYTNWISLHLTLFIDYSRRCAQVWSSILRHMCS